MSRTTSRSRPEDVPDELLMARYADGDAEAFEELFRRFEPRAFAYFLRRTGSRERAQDLYQDLFLRIHRARDSYDPGRPFTPWFFQIANRLLVDDHRRAFRGREVALDDREPRSARTGSEAEVANREHLAQLLEGLSAEERYVVVSAKVEGLGYAELADQLGKSADAVRKLASRALQRLRATSDVEQALHSSAN